MGTLSTAKLQGPLAAGVGKNSQNSPPACHGVRTEPPYIISILAFECSPPACAFYTGDTTLVLEQVKVKAGAKKHEARRCRTISSGTRKAVLPFSVSHITQQLGVEVTRRGEQNPFLSFRGFVSVRPDILGSEMSSPTVYRARGFQAAVAGL